MKYILLCLLTLTLSNTHAQGLCISKWSNLTTDCDKKDSVFYSELNQYAGRIHLKHKPYLQIKIDSTVLIEYAPIMGVGKVQKREPYRKRRTTCGMWITGPKELMKFLIDYAVINWKFYRKYCNQCHGIKL